jgi:asparagine synthase (glutamine-hydrolysing)
MGLSGAAELYGNTMARHLASVRLTGNCGGELLRGDRAFKHVFPQGTFITPVMQTYLYEAQKTFQSLETANAVTFALFYQFPSQGYGRMAIERSQVVLRTPFMDNDLVELIYQAPSQLLMGEKLSFALISRYKPELLKIPTDRGLLYNDFLFRNLARRFHREVLFKAEYWSTHGMPKWLAIISGYGLRNSLEKNFAGRHKFQHFSKWTRQPLGDYVTDVLLQGASNLPEFFDRHEMVVMLHEHVTGRRNYINELDKLLTITLATQTLFK